MCLLLGCPRQSTFLLCAEWSKDIPCWVCLWFTSTHSSLSMGKIHMLKTQQYQNYSRKAHSSQLQQIKECDIQNRVTQNRPIFSLKFIAEINSSKHSHLSQVCGNSLQIHDFRRIRSDKKLNLNTSLSISNYICSVQFWNLRNLEIALHILRIRKLRTNLEIADSI